MSCLVNLTENMSPQVHEAELVQELALKRVEAEKAEKQRISHAVSVAEVHTFTR